MNKYLKYGLIALLAGGLTFQFVVTLKINEKLDNIENRMEANNLDISEGISNIDSKVQSTLNEELSKSYLTKSVEFKLNKVEEDKYILGVRAELSKASDNTDVYFLYKEANDDKWKETRLSEDGTLSYIGKIEYKIGGRYEYKIVTKGSISESGDITYIDKYEFIPYPPQVSYEVNYEEGDKKLVLYLNKYKEIYEDEYGNYHEQNEKLSEGYKIKSIDIICSINDKEETYYCKNYKNEDLLDNGETNYDEGYRVEIPKDYYEHKLGYIKMKITYNNGVIDIKDITSEISEEFINY